MRNATLGWFPTMNPFEWKGLERYIMAVDPTSLVHIHQSLHSSAKAMNKLQGKSERNLRLFFHKIVAPQARNADVKENWKSEAQVVFCSEVVARKTSTHFLSFVTFWSFKTYWEIDK